MNAKLNLKVLRQMDKHFSEVDLEIQKVPDPETRDRLFAQLQQKRDAIITLFEYFEPMVRAQEAQKVTLK